VYFQSFNFSVFSIFQFQCIFNLSISVYFQSFNFSVFSIFQFQCIFNLSFHFIVKMTQHIIYIFIFLFYIFISEKQLKYVTHIFSCVTQVVKIVHAMLIEMEVYHVDLSFVIQCILVNCVQPFSHSFTSF